jgi:hypothetical protein
VGCFSAASRVSGILQNDLSITKTLHQFGALAFWDYTTVAAYAKIDMNPSVSAAFLPAWPYSKKKFRKKISKKNFQKEFPKKNYKKFMPKPARSQFRVSLRKFWGLGPLVLEEIETKQTVLKGFYT